MILDVVKVAGGVWPLLVLVGLVVLWWQVRQARRAAEDARSAANALAAAARAQLQAAIAASRRSGLEIRPVVSDVLVDGDERLRSGRMPL